MAAIQFAHEGDNGCWVVTVAEAAKYMGYGTAADFLRGNGHPADATGYLIGRWTGLRNTQIFPTLDAAIAAESLIPDRPALVGTNPSDALGDHLSRLDSGD